MSLQTLIQKFSIWLFRKSFDLSNNKKNKVKKGKGKNE